ncbi:MAG: hypothetical protein J6P95_02615 [Paludibacteraceae bacterium]|nr:hypothetical protein [Paludibacteraceae bacterium]
MNRKNLIFAAVLCVALVFGFSSCENPDDNEELLNRIEQLENQLKDQQSGKDDDKTDSADKDGDKDTSSDNEQNGNGTPDPDEGEDNSSDNEQNGEGTPKPETPTSGTENGYDYVDLGLPSGLNWATCNVGATKPEEYGNYYAWGEVEPKEVYTWSTYKFMDSSVNDWTGVNKYTFADYQTSGVWYDNSGNFIGDNKTVLDPEDDAAFVNMGGSWRMPTIEEQKELIDECTWTWTTLNGVNGYNVEGPNGNSIFLPAAGCRYDSDLYGAGPYGYYWSSSLYTDNSGYAYRLGFYSDLVYWYYYDRYYGLSVRGVFSE